MFQIRCIRIFFCNRKVRFGRLEAKGANKSLAKSVLRDLEGCGIAHKKRICEFLEERLLSFQTNWKSTYQREALPKHYNFADSYPRGKA